MSYFIGVDVGTGSVRSAVFSAAGERAAFATRSIKTWTPETDFYEQSSGDIWTVRVPIITLMERLTSNAAPGGC